jgi:hypothetical protein
MNNTSPPKPKLTRLDRWKEPQYGALLISPPPAPDGKLAQAIDEHWAKVKQKDPEQPNWSISDFIQSAKELIFDIVDGKPVFHVILFGFDPERFELCVSNVFDMTDLTPEEVRMTLVKAIARNVPVYPNTKDLEESLVRFHKDLIEDGFNIKDSSGKETRYKLVKPLTRVLENLNPIEVPSPAELCLMREALQNEISQRDHAGRILANLKIAIEELENSLTGKKRNENQIQRALTSNPILFGVEYCQIIPKHALGKDFEMDYALKRVSGIYDLVEIEASCHNLFTKGGNPTKELVHAEQQILDWLAWVEKHSAYAREHLPTIQEPIGFVVIGRRLTLSERDQNRLARRNIAFRGTFQILTYDDLLDRAKNLLSLLQG